MQPDHKILLARWGHLAGFSFDIEEPDDLTGLFQCFREAEDGIASLTSILQTADASGWVLGRVLEIFSATESVDYFAPTPQTSEAALALACASRHRNALFDFVRNPKLKKALSKVRVTYDGDVERGLEFAEDPRISASIAVGDRLSETLHGQSPRALHLLVPAAYSIANDEYIAAHVLWPLYDVLDSELFASYFEMWLLGHRLCSLSETHWVVTPI